MGLFGGKPNHKHSVETLVEFTIRLYRSLNPSGVIPLELRYERPDAGYRLLLFCESAIHYACASKMANPDAVLNETTTHLLALALADQWMFFGGSVEPQDAANRSILLQDFLNRWSSYKDIKASGSHGAALAIVASMLRDVEAAVPPSQDDAERLTFLAESVEKLIAKACVNFK